MKSTILNEVYFQKGGATPTVELYQRATGFCRLWWYCFDPDQSETIAKFWERNWEKAIDRGWELYQKFLDREYSK
jgi:hypothetical protein